MQWTGSGPNAYFQFGLGSAVADRPRDIADYGTASRVRFMAEGDVAGRQLQLNVFQALPAGGFTGPVASAFFSLSAGWANYELALPAGLRPQDVHALQFLMDTAHGAG